MLTAFVLVGVVAGSSAGLTARPFDSEHSQIAQGSPVEPVHIASLAPWDETAPHAVRGVVTRIEASSLVLRTTTSKPTELLFVLTPSTLTEGLITIGSTVSVRYRIEGTSRIAIAVRVRVTKLVADPWELTLASNPARS